MLIKISFNQTKQSAGNSSSRGTNQEGGKYSRLIKAIGHIYISTTYSTTIGAITNKCTLLYLIALAK
jgi:hypothetical protein